MSDGHSYYMSLHMRRFSATAALAVLVWEWAVTFDEEYRKIWRRPKSGIRWIFIFSRYFAIFVQFINNIVIFNPLSNIPVSLELCRNWLLFLMTCSAALVMALQVVLSRQVSRLYGHSDTIRIFLRSMQILEMVLLSTFTYRPKKIALGPIVDPLCNLIEAGPDTFIPSAAVVLSHGVLLIMTLFKQNLFGARREHLFNIIIRDGLRMFAMVVGIISLAIPYALYANMPATHIIFMWPISVFSIAICRIISNVEDAEPEILRSSSSLHRVLH